jgi:hypothetical protein
LKNFCSWEKRRYFKGFHWLATKATKSIIQMHVFTALNFVASVAFVAASNMAIKKD